MKMNLRIGMILFCFDPAISLETSLSTASESRSTDARADLDVVGALARRATRAAMLSSEDAGNGGLSGVALVGVAQVGVALVGIVSIGVDTLEPVVFISCFRCGKAVRTSSRLNFLVNMNGFRSFETGRTLARTEIFLSVERSKLVPMGSVGLLSALSSCGLP